MRLDDLGDRICVLGPSGSGKSTLAAAIGLKRDLPVTHLDQSRHRAGTQWELRPDDEFAELHDTAIATESWVIDGNYSMLLPQRLARATGLILLDIDTTQSLMRYLWRTFRSDQRVGGLEGTKDVFSWSMVQYILAYGTANRKRRREMFDQLNLPKILLAGPSSVRNFYRQECLRRP